MNALPLGQRSPARAAAFTLVELMVTAVIMIIVVVILGISLSQATLGPSVQTAAAQVASGLTLARQIAISKNTPTRFVIANTTNAQGLPEEPFRYWSVVSSNRSTTNTWVMEKEWEPLPAGAIFLNIAGRDYSTVNWDVIPAANVGKPHVPKYGNSGAGKEWEYFSLATASNMPVSYPDNAALVVHTFPSNMPFIGFSPSGAASAAGARTTTGLLFGSTRQVAVRVVQGAVDPEAGSITPFTDKNATYIETDNILGKVIVRSRESYRGTTP